MNGKKKSKKIRTSRRTGKSFFFQRKNFPFSSRTCHRAVRSVPSNGHGKLHPACPSDGSDRTTIERLYLKKRFSKKRFHHASYPPCRRSPRAVTSVLTGSQTVSISSGKLTRKAGSITLKITMLRQLRRTTESSPTNGRSYQFFLRPGTAEPTISDRGPTINHPDCRAWTDDTLTPHARGRNDRLHGGRNDTRARQPNTVRTRTASVTRTSAGEKIRAAAAAAAAAANDRRRDKRRHLT